MDEFGDLNPSVTRQTVANALGQVRDKLADIFSEQSEREDQAAMAYLTGIAFTGDWKYLRDAEAGLARLAARMDI